MRKASCIKLPTIFIPSSVSNIGYNAFYDCRSMTDIIIDKNDPLSLPGAIPWGGYEVYYEDKKSRGGKEFEFVVRNLDDEILFLSYQEEILLASVNNNH